LSLTDVAPEPKLPDLSPTDKKLETPNFNTHGTHVELDGTNVDIDGTNVDILEPNISHT